MSLKSPFATEIGRGAYSAIIFKDGDLIVAEDALGTVIIEGSGATTVIQAALDSFSSGMAVIAPGTYDITGTYGVGVDANKILRVSRGATLKQPNASNIDSIVRLKGNYAVVEGSGVIDGNKANQSSGYGFGVLADTDNAYYTSAMGLTVKDTRGNGIIFDHQHYALIHNIRALSNISGITEGAITVRMDSDHVTVSNCFVKDSNACGILGWGGGSGRTNICTRCIFANNQIENCGEAGIFLNAHDYAIVEGNNVRDADDHGINFEFCDHGTITGNVAAYNKVAGIGLFNSSHFITITGNLSEGNIQYISGAHGHGILLHGNSSSTDFNVVSGNVLKGNVRHGIHLLANAGHNVITSNIIFDNSKLADNTYSGICLDDVCSYNNIQNNLARYHLANRQKYGIRVNSSNCIDNFVTNNDLTSSGLTAAFSDAGTGTVTTAGNRT